MRFSTEAHVPNWKLLLHPNYTFYWFTYHWNILGIFCYYHPMSGGSSLLQVAPVSLFTMTITHYLSQFFWANGVTQFNLAAVSRNLACCLPYSCKPPLQSTLVASLVGISVPVAFSSTSRCQPLPYPSCPFQPKCLTCVSCSGSAATFLSFLPFEVFLLAENMSKFSLVL